MAASGSVADLIARLQRWLPARWFPTQPQNADGSVPRIYALLSGFAATFGAVWQSIQYARAQSRVATTTDGWLDLASADYLGAALPRLNGENDGPFSARIIANLPPKANTRSAVAAAITAVTGTEPTIIEPWNPNDTGVLDGVTITSQTWDEPGLSWDEPGLEWDSGLSVVGGCYYSNVPSASPGRLTTRRPYQAFIETDPAAVPVLGGAPLPCLDANAYFDAAGTYLFNLPGATPPGEATVLDAINRTKSEGTLIWVKFRSAPLAVVAGAPQSFIGANAYFDAAGTRLQ